MPEVSSDVIQEIREKLLQGHVLSDAYRKKHKELMQVYYTLVKLFLLWKRSLEDVETINSAIGSIEENIVLPDIMGHEELEKLKCAQQRIMNDVEHVSKEIDEMFFSNNGPIQDYLTPDIKNQWRNATSASEKERILKSFGNMLGVAITETNHQNQLSFQTNGVNPSGLINTDDNVFLQVLRSFGDRQNFNLCEGTNQYIPSATYDDMLNNENYNESVTFEKAKSAKSAYFYFRKQVENLFNTHEKNNQNYLNNLEKIFSKNLSKEQFNGIVGSHIDISSNQQKNKINYLTFFPEKFGNNCNSYTIGFFLNEIITSINPGAKLSVNALYEMLASFGVKLDGFVNKETSIKIYNFTNDTNYSISDNLPMTELIYNFINAKKFNDMLSSIDTLIRNGGYNNVKDTLNTIHEAEISNKKFLAKLLNVVESVCSQKYDNPLLRQFQTTFPLASTSSTPPSTNTSFGLDDSVDSGQSGSLADNSSDENVGQSFGTAKPVETAHSLLRPQSTTSPLKRFSNASFYTPKSGEPTLGQSLLGGSISKVVQSARETVNRDGARETVNGDDTIGPEDIEINELKSGGGNRQVKKSIKRRQLFKKARTLRNKNYR